MSVFLFLLSKNFYLFLLSVTIPKDAWFIESPHNSLHQQCSYSTCKLSASKWPQHSLLQKLIWFNSSLFPKWFTYILGYNSFSSFSESVQNLFDYLVNNICLVASVAQLLIQELEIYQEMRPWPSDGITVDKGKNWGNFNLYRGYKYLRFI